MKPKINLILDCIVIIAIGAGLIGIWYSKDYGISFIAAVVVIGICWKIREHLEKKGPSNV